MSVWRPDEDLSLGFCCKYSLTHVICQDVKAGWLLMEQHDAVRADVDRLTDLQENASSLQLNLEQCFANLAHDLDSVVHSQKRKKALSEAEADHKRAEELFEL